MKQVNALLNCLVLMVTSTLAIANSSQLNFVKRIANQINFAEQHQQAVWPGFHPASTPLVIQFNAKDETKSAYAINFKPSNLPWEKLSTLNMPLYYLPHSEILNINDDDLFMEIDGQNSFVDIEREDFLNLENFRPKIITERAWQYLIHESSIELTNFKYLNVMYDNFNNSSLIKLIYLEDRALTLSLQDNSHRAEEALRTAVAIHQYRESLMNKSAGEFEKGNEIINGIPTFIGWSSQQLNDIDYRKMAQRTGCMPLSTLVGHLGVYECVMFGFPTFSSSVYGHLLDKKMNVPDWKRIVEKQFRSPAQFAINYYHFTNDQAKNITETAMQNPAYNYDRIIRVIDHIMDSYLQSLEIAKTKCMNTPGNELRFPYEFGYLIFILSELRESAGGDSLFSNFYIVNNHTILLEDINFETDDRIVGFKHLPHMLLNEATTGFDDIDELSSYTSFKLSEDAQFVIDDVTFTANEFLRNKMIKSFHKLLITDQHIHMFLDMDAILDAGDGILTLKVEYKSSMMPHIKIKNFSKWIHDYLNHKKDVRSRNNTKSKTNRLGFYGANLMQSFH